MSDQPDGIRLELNVAGGIPLGLASYLMRAVGHAYPGTMVATDTAGTFGPTMTLVIPHADLYVGPLVTDEDVVTLAGEKDVQEIAGFVAGWRDGAFEVRPPAWLSTLLQTAAEQMVEAMPPTADNYVAMTITRPGRDSFTWIVSRPGRPSPHELRRTAEARVAQLEQQLQDAGIIPADPTGP